MKIIEFLTKHVTIPFLNAIFAALVYLIITGQPVGESHFFIAWLILIPVSMLINRSNEK